MLIRATNLWLKWERKEISDYALIKEFKNIIYEMSDKIIQLETEKAEILECLKFIATMDEENDQEVTNIAIKTKGLLKKYGVEI